MDGDRPDVVRVRVELMNSLQRVVVEDADFHVVWSGDDPMFTSDKFGRANGKIAHFESFGDLLRGIQIDEVISM